MSPSNAQLLLQLLSLSSSISQLSTLPLLGLSPSLHGQSPNINTNSNSLFAFSPELLSFISNCGNSFNSLSQVVTSPLNAILLSGVGNGNGNNENVCLNELLQLEQLFLEGGGGLVLGGGGNGNGNGNNNNNQTDLSASNSTASIDSNSAFNSTDPNATAAAAEKSKGKGAKGTKEARGKGTGLVQRSAGEKRRVLGGLGFVAFILVGACAL